MTNGNLGTIQSVDTGTVTIQIKDADILNDLQVNELLHIKSTNPGEGIIALITRIMRKSNETIDQDVEEDEQNVPVENLVKAQLIGTWYKKEGTKSNIFKRSLRVVPSIGSDSFILKGDELTKFMGAVSSDEDDSLELGKYTIQQETSAFKLQVESETDFLDDLDNALESVESGDIEQQQNLSAYAKRLSTIIGLPATQKKLMRLTANKVIEKDTALQESIDEISAEELSLEMNKASAFLNGNKFFQRHALIVGSTGSGKSWTVANILEKAAKLPSVNNIILDLHGEYQPLSKLDNTTTLKIAGPSDTAAQKNLIFLPYWLLSYEEIESMILDRSDNNAPNQARALFDAIIKYKQEELNEADDKQSAVLDNFTIDSPIPYQLSNVLKYLESSDKEMVDGARPNSKQGPLHGRLTRFIQRLKSKQSDKRLNFIFNDSPNLLKFSWLDKLVNQLMCFEETKKGSKIIDFSEVPSDILPLISGLVARLIFSVQQWTEKDIRHPIALFCDEAHLYIPQNANDSISSKGLSNFERIAKEGRKYGISLVVISQRPADVSKTVLSQCNNFIAMRLTNPDDQNVIKRLFPDNLGGFADLLPMLDIGECIIVGDACLLPSRIIVSPPSIKPSSSTVDIWTEWREPKTSNGLTEAVQALRQQSKS